MVEIITRRSGPDRASRFSLCAAGDTTQIAVRDSATGVIRVIHTGKDFSSKLYKAQGGTAAEDAHLKDFQPQG
jgi:hypothetical protein